MNILYQFIAEMLTFLCSNRVKIKNRGCDSLKPLLIEFAYSASLFENWLL